MNELTNDDPQNNVEQFIGGFCDYLYNLLVEWRKPRQSEKQILKMVDMGALTTKAAMAMIPDEGRDMPQVILKGMDGV